MATPMFNTHAVVKRLQQAGFTEQQAEVQADVLYEFVTENLATKDDLDRLRIATQTDLRQTEERLDHKIDDTMLRLEARMGQIEAATDAKIERAKSELTRTMVSVGFLQTGLIAALLLYILNKLTP